MSALSEAKAVEEPAGAVEFASKSKRKRRGISLADDAKAREALFAPVSKEAETEQSESAAVAAPSDADEKAVQNEGGSVGPTLRSLGVDSLRVDDRVQQRSGGLVPSVVGEYALGLESWIGEAPLVVFRERRSLGDESDLFSGVGYWFWLADGFHRLAAARMVGVRVVPCLVYDGSLRDAILFACGANASHGLRRTNADKRRSVLTLLSDSEWSSWSDRLVGERAGVSHPFVSKVRSELSVELVTVTSSTPPVSGKSLGADGKLRAAPKRSAVVPDLVSAPAPVAPPRSLVFSDRVFGIVGDLEDTLCALRRHLDVDGFDLIDLDLSACRSYVEALVDAISAARLGS